VTPALFARYPDAESLAKAEFEDVLELVRSVSYPNSKCRHIIEMSRMLVSEFNSEIPDEPDELVKLPGVGRKTANVVAAIIYGKPVIAVDTHVFRVSRRIGLSEGGTVEAVCRDLTLHIPEDKRADAHHWLLLHGRYVCTARNPKCTECPVRDFCNEHKQLV
ncbi:MAG: endonuclease III domain-containing protein, partial [Candidatus Cryptobacteroides sp.]